MESKIFDPGKSISLFVKKILVFEEQKKNQKSVLPFFADGYPGLMFQETENGLLVNPHNKQMPVLFLYGQTIKPVELILEGAYKLIIFQLYPFVLKSFFNISPADVNDDCYSLEQLKNIKGISVVQQLTSNNNSARRIEIITNLLYEFFQTKKESLDFKIKQAIQLIAESKGQQGIRQLCAELNLTERTFERRFAMEVGISPKQFSKIIQFQQSLEQLILNDYKKLTDIVYANGFADQSHFIRVFKAFTGETPLKFNRRVR